MNFKSAINNNLPIKENKKLIDISTWAQYYLKDGKFIRLDEEPELNEEEKIKEIDDIMKNISCAIENNRSNYMMRYDELHGEGAYERLYYMERIYDEVQLELESYEYEYEEEEYQQEQEE